MEKAIARAHEPDWGDVAEQHLYDGAAAFVAC